MGGRSGSEGRYNDRGADLCQEKRHRQPGSRPHRSTCSAQHGLVTSPHTTILVSTLCTYISQHNISALLAALHVTLSILAIFWISIALYFSALINLNTNQLRFLITNTMGNKQSSSAHHPSKIRFSRDRDRALFHHKSTQFHEKSTPHAAISVRHYGSSPSIDSYNSQGVHVHTTTEKSAQLRPAKHARVKSLPSSKHAPHLRQSRVLPPVPCPTDRPAFAAPSTVGFVPPPILPSLHSTSISSPESDPVDPAALAAFLRAYPEYNLTWSLDVLRQNEFSRLNVPHARETYVDYMGGALYPVSLVSVHAEFLKSAVMGNTHSASSRCVSVSHCATYHVLTSAQSRAARNSPRRS